MNRRFFTLTCGLMLAASARGQDAPVEQPQVAPVAQSPEPVEPSRPSRGGPIALTATGGGAALIGLAAGLAGAVLYLYTGFEGASYVAAGIAVLSVAGAGLIAGGILLVLGLTRLRAVSP